MDVVRRQSSKTRRAWRSTRIGTCMSPIGNHALRRIDASGCVITLVGSVPPHREKGDKNGAGSTARFSSPRAVASPTTGPGATPPHSSYIADTDNHRIRKVTGVVLPHQQMCKSRASRDGAARARTTTATRCRTPRRSLDMPTGSGPSPASTRRGSSGAPRVRDVIVADTNNHAVRKINATRFVFTIAGKLSEERRGGLPAALCSWCCWLSRWESSIARFEYPKSVAIDEPSSRHASTTDMSRPVKRKRRRTRSLSPTRDECGGSFPVLVVLRMMCMSSTGEVISTNGQVVTVAGSGLRARATARRTKPHSTNLQEWSSRTTVTYADGGLSDSKDLPTEASSR